MGMFTLKLETEKRKKVKPGDLVIIHDSAPNSGMVPEMEKYLGTVQKVDEASIKSIYIKGFFWSLKDVTHIQEPSTDPKKQEPVIFNEKELLEG